MKLWNSLLGKVSLRLSYRRVPRNQLLLKQVCLQGRQLVVPSNEDVGRLIVYSGSYEPEETEYLASALRPDDVCFDVGANIGYYTTLMARATVRGWVHAFEPDPLCTLLLELNVHLNKLNNVSLNRVALGAIPGQAQLVRATDSGFNSLRNTDRLPVSGILDVAVSTVDAYLNAHGSGRVDVLKIDVEGAEGLVVEGARQLLSDPCRRPRLILLELFEPNHRPFGVGISDIVEGLCQHGYKPFVVSRGNELAYTQEFQNHFVNVFFHAEELTSGRAGQSRATPCLI